MTDERTYYIRDIIRICEDRGFTPKMVEQFLNTHDNMVSGYTEGMVDAFEYSVNGPVIGRLHPDMAQDV